MSTFFEVKHVADHTFWLLVDTTSAACESDAIYEVIILSHVAGANRGPEMAWFMFDFPSYLSWLWYVLVLVLGN